MNKPEDDNSSNINNQEKKNLIFNNSTIMNFNNELKDKIYKIDCSSEQREGLFGNSDNDKRNSLFGNTNNNLGGGLFQSNKGSGLFSNISNYKEDNQGIFLFENCLNNPDDNLFGNSNSNQNNRGLFNINNKNSNNYKYLLGNNKDKNLYENNHNSTNAFNSLSGKIDNNSAGKRLFNYAKNTNSLNKNNNTLLGNLKNYNNNFLINNVNNNKENSLFGSTKINYNQAHGLFRNPINQGNKKKYRYEDLTVNNIINQLEYEGKNDEDENTLVKIMKEIEEDENINGSGIKNQKKENSTLKNSLIDLYDELRDKIPKIRIKNENLLFNENIICEKCLKNNHYFFCEKCSINLCNICSKDCKEKHQNKLINLKEKIEYYKREIHKIIKEYFSDNIKNVDEPIKKLEHTNDIKLIKHIMESSCNNYLHCKIMENCYIYMKNEYDINNQISLDYKIKSNETEITIFGYHFVKNNKGKCFIIFEDEKFELIDEFELKNKINIILKIKLIDINNVTNMSYMFNGCKALISLPDISKLN